MSIKFGAVCDENDYYEVLVAAVPDVVFDGCTYEAGYAVVNKTTGVHEYYSPNLTTALAFSARAALSLEMKPWEEEYKLMREINDLESNVLPDGTIVKE